MDLTNQEIQTILEIIDSVSIPVKQSREIVQPIINKLNMKLLQDQGSGQAETKKEEVPAS